MLNDKKMKDAISLFCKNDYWRKFYEGAPTDKCKRHIALGFYHSTYYADIGIEEAYKQQKAIEQKLTLADWKHLYKYSGNNPWRLKCKEMIEKLEKKG